MFWGVSPALDLQQEYLDHCDEDMFELNMLVIGGCDARHVLKTLAHTYRHRCRYVNLFVVDACPELIARQMMLVSLAMERTERVGLLEKTRRFMEVYGNSLLRPATSRYLAAKSQQLVKMVTDPDYMRSLLPVISVDQMKFRDRDYIDNLFKFWTTGSTNQFDIRGLWERRLRRSLGTRYDTRAGVFDWDYHMRMSEVARIIGSQEYKHFRETGVAFTWLETEVCRPNTSLAAGVYRCGERFLHSGYLGDLVTGPFVGYGLTCEDQDMLKTSEPRGQYYKRCVDVTERNVMRMLYELENRKPFEASQLRDTQHDLGLSVLADLDARQSAAASEAPLLLHENRDTYINLDYGKVHFLSLSALEHYPNKAEFRNFFHVSFLGNLMMSRTRPVVLDMMREGGLVIVESRKYLVDLKREDVKTFGDQISELAIAAHCSPRESFDPQKDDFAKFVVERGSGRPNRALEETCSISEESREKIAAEKKQKIDAEEQYGAIEPGAAGDRSADHVSGLSEAMNDIVQPHLIS